MTDMDTKRAIQVNAQLPRWSVSFAEFRQLCWISCILLRNFAHTKCQWTSHNFVTSSPIHRGTGYCFRSISLFLCFFVSKIMRKRLDRFAWNFQGRCWVTMEQPDSILGQFGETAWCCDAQHGDGVCCALAPQLVCIVITTACAIATSCLLYSL